MKFMKYPSKLKHDNKNPFSSLSPTISPFFPYNQPKTQREIYHNKHSNVAEKKKRHVYSLTTHAHTRTPSLDM